MARLLHEYATQVSDHEGTRYTVRSYGEQRADGTWTGWLEFTPEAASNKLLKTREETSQPNLTDLEYWASGLEPVYLDGALARAQDRLL